MQALATVFAGISGFSLLAFFANPGHSGRHVGIWMFLGFGLLAVLTAVCASSFSRNGAAAPGAAGAGVRAAVASSWSSHPMWWLWFFGFLSLWIGLTWFPMPFPNPSGAEAFVAAMVIATLVALAILVRGKIFEHPVILLIVVWALIVWVLHLYGYNGWAPAVLVAMVLAMTCAFVWACLSRIWWIAVVIAAVIALAAAVLYIAWKFF